MSLSDKVCLPMGIPSYHLSRSYGEPGLCSRHRRNLCLAPVSLKLLAPRNFLMTDSLEPPGSRVHIGEPPADSFGNGVTDLSAIDLGSVGDDDHVHTFTVDLSDAFFYEGRGNGKLAQASSLTHAAAPAGMSGQRILYTKEKSHELVKIYAT